MTDTNAEGAHCQVVVCKGSGNRARLQPGRITLSFDMIGSVASGSSAIPDTNHDRPATSRLRVIQEQPGRSTGTKGDNTSKWIQRALAIFRH
jgi:hypothetical protein